MAKRLSDFKRSSACVQAVKINTATKTNRHFDEAVIAKDYCKAAISGDWTPTTIDELVEEIEVSYSDENMDDVDETQHAFAKKLAKGIFRYGKSEYRHNAIIPEDDIILDLSEFVTTQFEDCDDIHVKFDAIVREPGKLEGIIYKKGTPKIGTTARSYNNVNNSIELHLMRLALRKYADTFLDDGEQIAIFASYYYMNKTKDKSTDAFERDDYFSSGEPIRSQEENYIKGVTSIATVTTEDSSNEDDERPKSLDELLLELLDAYATGFEKCDLNEEKDCASCRNYCLCYYQPAPVRAAEEKTVKKREKHQLNEEQQAIVDFRHGIATCNAVPGAGKTETVVKQRPVTIVMEQLDDLVKRWEAGEDIDIDLEEEASKKPIFLTMDSRR